MDGPTRCQRATLPAFKHEVQTFSRFDVPPMTVRTVWMLGLKRRFVRRWEWETLLPNPGPLPQISQTADTGTLPCMMTDGAGRSARARRQQPHGHTSRQPTQIIRPAAGNANWSDTPPIL